MLRQGDPGESTQRPIRVVQINAVYGTGSTGRNCLELDESAAPNGIEMHSAYSVPSPFQPSNKILIGSAMDHKVHGLMSRITGQQGYSSQTATRHFLRTLDGLSPDVLHLNNLHANFINLPMLFSYIRTARVPTVITLHDCWFYTGGCTHYTTTGCYKWLHSCGSCPRLAMDNPSWFFDRSSKILADKLEWLAAISNLTVVGVSQWITSEARRSRLGRTAKFRTIYNWVDLARFTPGEGCLTHPGLPKERYNFFILGVASRWNEAKGLSQFLSLARQLAHDEAIILVGELPDGVDLPDNVLHVQKTDSVESLVGIYRFADVFVSFSQEETFGKVTAESLACGTPVILGAGTANPELLGSGCGHLITSGNESEYRSAIATVRRAGKMHYSDSCRAHALACFDADVNRGLYYKLYRELAQTTPAPRTVDGAR